MDKSGILVGADEAQEPLLSWWWTHYHQHNALPVTFADFGMTEKARKWCLEKGQVLEGSDFFKVSGRKAFSPEKQKDFEERYGPGIWKARVKWFKKPFALFESPYKKTLWLDLDCQVLAPIDEMFQFLEGSDVALAYDQLFSRHGAPFFNGGVILYRNDSPFMRQYKEAIFEMESKLATDQDVLTYALKKYQPSFSVLPQIYNWRYDIQRNLLIKILHFCGQNGKEAIDIALRLKQSLFLTN